MIQEVCSKCGKKIEWFDFIYTKHFQFFMTILKIIGLIFVIWLCWTIISDIHTFQILNKDACLYCMNKTGANCFIPPKW